MTIREKITETAERIYDIVNDGKYTVKANFFSKKKEGEKPSSIKIVSSRDTAHTKKWRAKNR